MAVASGVGLSEESALVVHGESPGTATVAQGCMPRFLHGELHVRTTESCGFHDITDHVKRFAARCEMDAGMLLLVSMHTTAGLLINEHETGFRADFRDFAERMASRETAYRHDDMSVRFENICPEDREFPNGHAHLQHTALGAPSLVVPIQGAQVVLGQWQRIFVIEFDRPRARRISMHGFGLAAPGTPAVGAEERSAAPTT